MALHIHDSEQGSDEWLTQRCGVNGCHDVPIKRGWCSKHYQRWRKHGDPTLDRKKRALSDGPKRFWSKVDTSGYCWRWQGTMNDSGYGIFLYDGKFWRAHRWLWSVVRGEIPPGMQIDHRCRNRACVNPDHLRLASNKQNAEHVEAFGSSGYRGVSFSKHRNKWVVQVTHLGVNNYGGYFTDLSEAAEAAKVLRNKLFTHNDADRSAL